MRRTTRSVLIFTTAGKTFATAKTAGSEAGSACAKHGAEFVQHSRATASPQTTRLGSACVSRAGFGVAPKRSFLCLVSGLSGGALDEKFVIARTRSPARGTHALPKVLDFTLIIASRFLQGLARATPDTLRRFERGQARPFFVCSVAASYRATPTLCRE